MSVRVNLLPRELADRQRANRQRLGLVLLGVLFLLLLGAIYVWQSLRVSDARAVLADEQQRVAELEGEVADLDEFRDLDERVDQAIGTVTTAMAAEASVAGILQDVAAVFPADSSLESLTITLTEETPPSLGAQRPSFGTMLAVGTTLRNHAPGVERVLLQLDKVASFQDLFFANTVIDEEAPLPNVVDFNIEASLGPEIFTQRYTAGLPEGLR